MVIPIIAATSRDLIRQVPLLPREGAVALGMSDWECASPGDPPLGGGGGLWGAVALGMSDWECASRVTLPWVGSGIVGATVLGLGRALGETIAVAMVCGVNLGQVATNLYATMSTIAANIVLR